jgi:hypothetical protein
MRAWSTGSSSVRSWESTSAPAHTMMKSLPRFAWIPLLAGTSLFGSVITPVNNSFESPVVPAGDVYENVVTGPSADGDGWSYPNGNSGVVAYRSSGEGYDITEPSATGGDGNQAAILQNGDGTGVPDGTISGSSAVFSQSLSGFTDGTASVSFYIEARDNSSQYQVTVYLDDTPLVFSYPADYGAHEFDLVTTTPITVTAGSHTLSFVGNQTVGGDSAFIDLVTVNNTPEPASLGLLSLASLGLLRRSKRSR